MFFLAYEGHMKSTFLYLYVNLPLELSMFRFWTFFVWNSAELTVKTASVFYATHLLVNVLLYWPRYPGTEF